MNLIATYAQKIKCIIVDFHAEATSEKIAMAWHLDGKVSAIIGTHTHVQTHDEWIMPQGTAYVTDVGMVGSREGVLGMEKEAVLRKFMTQLPTRFNVAGGKWHFHAVLIEIDEATGRRTISSSFVLTKMKLCLLNEKLELTESLKFSRLCVLKEGIFYGFANNYY